MAKKAVVDAIIARLKTNFTLAPVLDRNVTTQTPADGGPWVRIEFPVANDLRTALGLNWRETGSARIVIASPIGDGIDTSNSWCEQIATIFRGQKFSGVDCYQPPSIREGIDDGSYFIAAVIVPYRFEYAD
ncbi:MAG: phage tail terminator-like protein [Methylocystis sp.]